MNTNAFENESSKKRLEHLNNKRKEKLRFELIDEHGIKVSLFIANFVFSFFPTAS
jgi:hypothetical protein